MAIFGGVNRSSIESSVSRRCGALMCNPSTAAGQVSYLATPANRQKLLPGPDGVGAQQIVL